MQIFLNFHSTLIDSVLLKIQFLLWALCQTTLWSFRTKRIGMLSIQIESHFKNSKNKKNIIRTANGKRKSQI